jgi:hypothetical protein
MFPAGRDARPPGVLGLEHQAGRGYVSVTDAARNGGVSAQF